MAEQVFDGIARPWPNRFPWLLPVARAPAGALAFVPTATTCARQTGFDPGIRKPVRARFRGCRRGLTRASRAWRSMFPGVRPVARPPLERSSSSRPRIRASGACARMFPGLPRSARAPPACRPRSRPRRLDPDQPGLVPASAGSGPRLTGRNPASASWPHPTAPCRLPSALRRPQHQRHPAAPPSSW